MPYLLKRRGVIPISIGRVGVTDGSGIPTTLNVETAAQVTEEGEGDIHISLKKVKVLYHTLYYSPVVQHQTITLYYGRSYSIAYSVA